jgi:hypothetical protein
MAGIRKPSPSATVAAQMSDAGGGFLQFPIYPARDVHTSKQTFAYWREGSRRGGESGSVFRQSHLT